MKKVILLAVGALALASVTAYAQMNHHGSQAQSGHGMHGSMHSQMHGEMHDQMRAKMHGKMHGRMHGKGAGNQHDGHDAHGAAVPRAIAAPQAWHFTASTSKCMKA